MHARTQAKSWINMMRKADSVSGGRTKSGGDAVTGTASAHNSGTTGGGGAGGSLTSSLRNSEGAMSSLWGETTVAPREMSLASKLQLPPPVRGGLLGPSNLRGGAAGDGAGVRSFSEQVWVRGGWAFSQGPVTGCGPGGEGLQWGPVTGCGSGGVGPSVGSSGRVWVRGGRAFSGVQCPGVGQGGLQSGSSDRVWARA